MDLDTDAEIEGNFLDIQGYEYYSDGVNGTSGGAELHLEPSISSTAQEYSYVNLTLRNTLNQVTPNARAILVTESGGSVSYDLGSEIAENSEWQSIPLDVSNGGHGGNLRELIISDSDENLYQIDRIQVSVMN
jgi:hypothetical protein